MKWESKEAIQIYSKVATAIYFNQVFASLILRDDKYLISQFDRWTAEAKPPHSPICLLNILASICCDLHEKVDRAKCDKKSLESFSSSVAEQVKKITIGLTEILYDILNHECKGAPLPDKYDPKTPMFVLDMEVKKHSNTETRHCHVCGKVAKQRCSGCTTRYCSKECQRKDWKSHKRMCFNK